MQPRTALAQARFLDVFARMGNMLRACQEAHVGRQTVYDWLDRDENFRALYEAARQDAIDKLEAEARRRAEEGVNRPVYQGGELVGFERVYSDKLMELLLKGHRPEVFRDRTEVTGVGGGPIELTWKRREDE